MQLEPATWAYLSEVIIMAHFEVVKAVRIDGKVYNNPKFAALRWVKSKMREACYKRTPGTKEYDRAWRRYWTARLEKRYARMAQPYFEKLLS